METPEQDLDVKPVDEPGMIDLCATERAAVKVKEAEIDRLKISIDSLKKLLADSTPQQKTSIMLLIKRDEALLELAEAALPILQGLLDRCQDRFPRDQEVGLGGNVPVTPG
jgi:hypothetical protein